MDRFIEIVLQDLNVEEMHLKSNMDRFIARSINRAITSEKNLKSNMDRFIVFSEHSHRRRQKI